MLNTIKIALESYDKKKLTYAKQFKTIDKVKISFSSNDVDSSNIETYNETKSIYRGNFELISIMRYDLFIWSWAWTIPGIYKSLTTKVRGLLDYGLNKMDDSGNEILQQIKQFLINGSVYLDDGIKKDILLSLISYLSKTNIILELKISTSEYEKLKSALLLKKSHVELDILKVISDNYYYILFISI